MSWATFSMSTPPSVEAMNTMRRLERSTTAPRYRLLVDVGAGLHQDLADRLAVGVGLVGHQVLAQPLLGERLGVLFALHQLHTARFTAAAGVHLSFDDPLAAADLVAGFCGLFGGVYGKALGYRQAVFSEQLLTLIFVEIHACLPLFV